MNPVGKYYWTINGVFYMLTQEQAQAVCQAIGHQWLKGGSRWRCSRCDKKRRRRNRAGGR